VTPIAARLPIADVLVLEDRARVVRRGRVALGAGQSRIVVDGVAPVLVDRSLAAEAIGATVLDVRCERRLADPADAERDGAERARDAAALEVEQRAAAAEVERLDADATRAHADADGLAELARLALAELAAGAARGRAPAGAAERLATLDGRERDARARAAELDAAAGRARAELDALGARLGAARADAGREAARVVIDVVCDRDGDIEIGVDYVVPGACWRPYHTATLDRAGGHLEVATDACVWQSTGEDWREVPLRFSTERPSLGATPPALVDDILRVQKKSDVTVVEARDHDVDVGLGAGAARVAATVPGIDDGGVARVLVAVHRAIVISDGRPYRVPVTAFSAPAEIAEVAVPERSPCAFVRARATHAGDAPLLAGPVDLVLDHGYVGRASTLFVAPGERFDLGFGPDADVRVHREDRRKRDDAGVLGGWNVTRVRVAVRLSNLGAAVRTIQVTERVPVSEIEAVEVAVSPATAWALEDDDGIRRDDAPIVTERAIDGDGLVTWSVELPPYGRRAVALEYEVRSKKGVVGL